MHSLRFFSLCLLSVLGCSSAIKQAPRSAPHGVVELRIIHRDRDRDATYDDQARVGLESFALEGRKERLRLPPGLHYVELTSLRTTYGLATRDRPVGPPMACGDVACAVTQASAPRHEPRVAVEPRDDTRCEVTKDLNVAVGSETLILLIVGPENKCVGCVAEDTSARECPGS